MKKADVLLGLQWGDEGKGKFVDVISNKYDIVARFQGGPNAGHTLEFDGEKHILHTIPSGIFNEKVMNIIGNGVVIDAVTLKKEIEEVSIKNPDIRKNLIISQKAHLILPSHRLLDTVQEAMKGDAKIGSTLKGIGPTYTDKVSRNGLRIGDILAPDFKSRYEKIKQQHITLCQHSKMDLSAITIDKIPFEEYETLFFEALELLRTFSLSNIEYLIYESLLNNKSLLAEGAQGTLLDLDYGTYPFVTSSNTITAGACVSLGLSPHYIDKVIGICKAYTTRVGNGTFPTELCDQDGEKLQNVGHEFGSTTGRARRCGWLDLVALKYAVMINGVTEIILTKADVLNSFETIKVATGYNIGGTITDQFPFDVQRAQLEPVYETLQGWNTDTSQLRKESEMPEALQAYVKYIEQQVQVPISIVSVGPDRTETIFIK